MTVETCDRCGPAVTAAVAVVLFTGGRLTYCGHCATRFMLRLLEVGVPQSLADGTILPAATPT